MAYEIQGKPTSPVAIRSTPDVSTGAVVAEFRVTARVFVFQALPGWRQVRVLEGDNAGRQGWARDSDVISVQSTIVSSEQELFGLFATLREAHFTPPSGVPTPVPYRYPMDGCFARAEIMANLLAASDYTVDKVFAIAAGGLRVKTPHGGDQPGLGERLQVGWWYHVAPIVYVPSGGPKPEPMLLDPSVSDGPTTIGVWVGKMATSPIESEISYDQLRQYLQAAKAYPNDRTLVVRAGATVYSPPLAANPSMTMVGKPDNVVLELARTARFVPAHDVVAALDQLFRRCFDTWTGNQSTRNQASPYPTYGMELNSLRQRIQALLPDDRNYIRSRFPNFFTDWRYTFVGSGVEQDFKNLEALLSS